MIGIVASENAGGSVRENVKTPIHPFDDPLFVSPNENVGNSLVTEQLTGAMDYIPCKKAMEMALSGKMKLAFVQAFMRGETCICNLVVQMF
ncbi:hypothetical protein QQ045_007464 [Rhodiola kirilowii]